MIKQFGKMLLDNSKSGVKNVAASSLAQGQKKTARMVRDNLRTAGESRGLLQKRPTRPKIIQAADAGKTPRAPKAPPKPAYGNSILGKFGPRAGVGTAAITVGVGVPSFLSGIDEDNQVSDSVYNLAFGDPNFDEYVMGRKMGIRSLAMPFPGERTAQGLTPTGIGARAAIPTTAGAAVGLGAGALFSAGFGLKGIRGMAMKGLGTVAGAAVGGGVGANAAFNNQPYRDAWRANRKQSMQVDGSMAFGMYNARLG